MGSQLTRSVPLLGVLFVAGVAAGAGCATGAPGGGSSSSGAPAGGSDATAPDDSGSSSDVAQGDASAQGDAPRDVVMADGAVVSGCAIRHEKTGAACGDVCGVHLTLVGPSDWYCTQDCSDPTQCGGVAGLTCAPYGACVPTCAGDAECKAQGFKRCDTAAGACDTL